MVSDFSYLFGRHRHQVDLLGARWYVHLLAHQDGVQGVMGFFVDLVTEYTLWLGRRCDDTADFLEKTAETLRWLAVVTRVTP